MIDNFLSDVELKKLRQECLNYHSKYGKPYPFGTGYSIQDPLNLPNESLQKAVFLKPWMKELFLSFNNGVSKGSLIVFTPLMIIYSMEVLVEMDIFILTEMLP